MVFKLILDVFLLWCDKCLYVYKINGFVDVVVLNNYLIFVLLYNDGIDRCIVI